MDVINLVSSDEEDVVGGLRTKNRQNKNVSMKKLKELDQNVNQKSNQCAMKKDTTSKVQHQNNNNHKSSMVLNGPKRSKLALKQKKPAQMVVTKILSKDGNIAQRKNSLSMTSSSGITITPISSVHGSSTGTVTSVNTAVCTAINSISKSPKSSRIINMSTITKKPRPETVTIVSKTNASLVNVKSIKPMNNTETSKPAKRIVPTKISDTVTMRASSIEKSSDSDMLSRDSSLAANDEMIIQSDANGTEKSDDNEINEPQSKRLKIDTNENAMHEDYAKLLQVCETADPSAPDDMKKIIAKLQKYYHRAHKDFVNSSCFHKLVISATNEITAKPELVYMQITSLMAELKTRQANDQSADAEQPIEDPEFKELNEKQTKKIKRLSDALHYLQRKIRTCEQSEVDWNDENNSKYLLTERYKKRACEIYDKLCDLTGESRHAERIVKKPIKFNGTSYREFNRKLERFLNETKSFPDMFDVLRIMDYCSKLYGYRLSKEQRMTVAQEAFHEVGTLLQKRRKTDLYEMVQYFTANDSDPAVKDTSLKLKLEENQRHYSKRMKEVIEKYSMHNDDSESIEDDEEKSPAKKKTVKTSSKVLKVATRPTSNVLPEVELISESMSDPMVDSVIETVPEAAEMNLNADIDMLNEGISFISDTDDITGTDAILIDEDDARELTNDFLPTITSVTSIDPSEFHLFDFSSPSQLGSAEII